MRWSDINRNPTPATLRQFSAIWLVFFLGLACWQYFLAGHQLAGAILAVLALTAGPLGLARPTWVRWIFVGWMMLTFPIGWTISQVMLLLLFYGIFTPLALLFRIKGRDVLLRANRPRDSFWLVKDPPADIHSYFRQS
jgi:hypothetical protein